MDDSTLTTLAERCEAAAGPDRDLAEEVLLACGWRKSSVGYFLGPLHMWSSPGFRSFDADDFARHDPTASIDTAVTLIPEGHEWSVNWCGNSVAEVSELPDGTPHRGHAATPALALCAAALRALSLSPVTE